MPSHTIIKACPNCGRKFNNPNNGFDTFLLALPLFILLFAASIGFLYDLWREEYDWDRMDATSYDDLQNGTIVKVAGTINSTEDVVLLRYEKSERWYWNHTDFNITLEDSSILVNLSNGLRGENIFFNGSDTDYRKGDLVFVVGTMRLINDTWIIDAEAIAYDMRIFDDFFHSMLIVFIIIEYLTFSVMIISHFVGRPFPIFRHTTVPEDFPKVDPPPWSLPEGMAIPERFRDPLTLPIILTGILYFITLFILLFISLLAYNMVPGMDLKPITPGWVSSSWGVPFFFLPLMLAFPFILFVGTYSTTASRYHLIDSGIIYSFGFSELQFLPWKEIAHSSEKLFVITVHLRDGSELPMFSWKQSLREEIDSRIKGNEDL